MFEKYLLCLFKQYCDARGLDVNNVINIYSNNFVDWLDKNKALLDDYIDYLNALGFDYIFDDVIEVGKGKYDSLAQYGVNLVSPFAETVGKFNSRLVINKDISLIIKENEITIPKEHILLTHNPYFESEIFGWNLIHNLGNKNISIGMFGNLDDEDISRKVRLLESLAEQMMDDYSFDYDTSNGNYFCSLNSERYIKRKSLSK